MARRGVGGAACRRSERAWPPCLHARGAARSIRAAAGAGGRKPEPRDGDSAGSTRRRHARHFRLASRWRAANCRFERRASGSTPVAWRTRSSKQDLSTTLFARCRARQPPPRRCAAASGAVARAPAAAGVRTVHQGPHHQHCDQQGQLPRIGDTVGPRLRSCAIGAVGCPPRRRQRTGRAGRRDRRSRCVTLYRARPICRGAVAHSVETDRRCVRDACGP